MKSEIWDILDDNRQLTGRTICRNEKLADHEFHLIAHAWIKSHDNKYLITKRKATKLLYPGLWETTGGCAISGENSKETALREVKEEVGIILEPQKGRLFKKLNGQNNYDNHFIDVWIFNQEIQSTEIIIQEDEVEEYKFLSAHEISELMKTGNLVPDYENYINDLFKENEEI